MQWRGGIDDASADSLRQPWRAVLVMATATAAHGASGSGALAAVVAAVNLACWLAWQWWPLPGAAAGGWFAGDAFWWVTLGTLGLLLAGSLRKAWQLRHGGESLAAMLGAREIASHSGDPAERRGSDDSQSCKFDSMLHTTVSLSHCVLAAEGKAERKFRDSTFFG